MSVKRRSRFVFSLFFLISFATKAGNWTDTVCNMADREPNMSAGIDDTGRYFAYQNFGDVMKEL